MQNDGLNLPNIEPDAQQHSTQLCQQIMHEIECDGAMPFARFMQLALYAPGLGYYSAGAHKLGPAGDFITAPELTPLFAQCLAKQCQQVLSQLKGGEILELGAGTGVLALELLLELQRMDCLPARYWILEVSADLRQRQQALLAAKAPALLALVSWTETMPALKGVILANEVMDAMPVHLVHHSDQGWQEYYVNWQQRFVWQLGALSDPRLNAFLAPLDLPVPYTTEVNLLLQPWIASLASALQQGAILLIDYGFPRHEYYHADRSMGTLMCHFRHRAHGDPFHAVGLQDITAHVDFTAVAEAATQHGLLLEGFVHQAGFLLNCGIAERLAPLDDATLQLKRSNAIKQLMMPSEMGELFKVIGFQKEMDSSLLGFVSMNQRGRL